MKKKIVCFLSVAVLVHITACGHRDATLFEPVLPNSPSPSAEAELPADDAPSATIATPVDSIYVPRELTAQEEAMLETPFTIPSDALSQAQAAIADYAIAYPYEEWYDLDPYQIPDYTPSVRAGTLIRNGVVDGDRLGQIVLENNRAAQEAQHINAYEGTTDAFVLESCETIARQVTDFIAQFDLDVDLIEEKLQNLQAFSYTGFGDGVYSPENNRLLINGMTADENVIHHEIVHLLQAASSLELADATYDSRLGYVFMSNSAQRNPYYWNWFVEASAESMAMFYTDRTEPAYYPSEYKMLEAFKLINFETGLELEETLFSASIESLYSYFQAETPEEQEEVRRLFYGATLYLDSSPGYEGSDFMDYLRDSGIVNLYADGQTHLAFEEQVKGCVALTETKLFYQNLCEVVAEQSLTLEELFSVLSVFEIEISRQTWYNSKYDQLGDFVPTFALIQGEFLDAVASGAGITPEAVRELYYLFNASYSAQEEVQVSWLDDAQNAYFTHINNSREGNRMDAILKFSADYFGV